MHIRSCRPPPWGADLEGGKWLLAVALTLLALLAAYSLLFARAGDRVFWVPYIYGPLSYDPLLGALGSATLVLSLALAALAAYRRDVPGNAAAALTLLSASIIVAVKFLVPDLADRYYITDFEDSFNHMYRAMYIAEFGHLTPYFDFMWLNRSFWLTLAEAILVLWGHPTWFKDLPFYFTIKWGPELLSIMMMPPAYLLARSAGLSRRASGLAVVLSTALWPEMPYVVSNDYGTITFTVALSFFILALRERDRRLLAPLLLAVLAAAYTHELVAALMAVALIGGAAMYVLFPEGVGTRRAALSALAASLSAYLIMALYNSYGFVQQGINYYWHVTLSTLRSLLYHTPSIISQTTYRVMPAYHAAVEVKAAAYILELVLPFAVSLALAIRRPSYRILIGALGLAGLVGAALTLGLSAVGWADRVPIMMLGVIGVIVAGLAEVRRHRRAAVAVLLASAAALAPLALYASFAGYPAVAFPEVGWDLGTWWVVTESGGYQPGVAGELAPGSTVAYWLPPVPAGQWCNATVSGTWFEVGYMGYYYLPYFIYSAYASCPDYQHVYFNVVMVKYNNSVVIDTPVGYLAVLR